MRTTKNFTNFGACMREVYRIAKYTEANKEIKLMAVGDEHYAKMNDAKEAIIDLIKADKNARFVILTEIIMPTDSRAG